MRDFSEDLRKLEALPVHKKRNTLFHLITGGEMEFILGIEGELTALKILNVYNTLSPIVNYIAKTQALGDRVMEPTLLEDILNEYRNLIK
jgi:hypothetical protein